MALPNHIRRTRRASRWVGVALALALAGGLVPGSLERAPAAPASFTAAGSVEQVYATGLPPGASVSLVGPTGAVLQTRRVNPLGGVLFRNVPPGSGYRVRLDADGTQSAPLTVHEFRPEPWDPSIYDQTIPSDGYTYITTRDGTKLAVSVHPPTNPAIPTDSGLPDAPPLPNLPGGAPFTPPYPTLIEYSGYGYARPSGPVNGIATLANLMGFAVVDVNMRGTGCSGGAFDFFEPLQLLDGYDVIEIVARQPWVKHNKVGMLGISYGGISQLFVAQLNPPSLAAISPVAVIDATATTLYPGGILNTGFAVEWAKERQREARPAGPDAGQRWAYERIQAGDTVCAANQALHDEATDLMAKIEQNSHYNPAVADPLDPVTFVHNIKVPTFLACQWQDEQTGGHCPELASRFSGTDKAWFTFTNGPHIDSLAPETFNRLYDFLMLYVAKDAPIRNQALIRAAAPFIYQLVLGLPPGDVVPLPPDPIQAIPTYEEALAAFEKLPRVRVLFENGAGASPTGERRAGNPYPAFEQSFPSLPVPGTVARAWYLGPGGTLSDRPPAVGGADGFIADARALPLTNHGPRTGTGGLWGSASEWQWDWRQNPPGTALSYVTEPLPEDTAVIGAGSVHLWARSSTPDVDLQVTVTEVRPDGTETFVQNGYLRASQRKLSTGTDNLLKRPSTYLDPVPSFRRADAAPMPADRFVELAIPLYYQGHVYRKGSRIRIIVAAPNGAQPVWSFSRTVPHGTARVAVSYSSETPSALVLPVVPGVRAPTPLPPCPGLRNQPCRTFVALANAPASALVAGEGTLPATGSWGGSTAGMVCFALAAAFWAARRRVRATAQV